MPKRIDVSKETALLSELKEQLDSVGDDAQLANVAYRIYCKDSSRTYR